MREKTPTSLSSDQAILTELAERVTRYRLNRNLTQEMLAREAGVSRLTIVRIEQGRSTQLSNFLRVLRALNLIENVNALIPEPVVSPLQQAMRQGKRRQRARPSIKPAPQSRAWKWGDES